VDGPIAVAHSQPALDLLNVHADEVRRKTLLTTSVVTASSLEQSLQPIATVDISLEAFLDNWVMGLSCEILCIQ